MARITVEDCLEHIDNRFQLVLVATKRARQLALGAESLVPMNNDKPTVVALREIAAGLVTSDILDQTEPTVDMEFATLGSGSEYAPEAIPTIEPNADTSTDTKPDG